MNQLLLLLLLLLFLLWLCVLPGIECQSDTHTMIVRSIFYALSCHSQAWVRLPFKAQLDVAATIVQHNHLWLVPAILHGRDTSASSTLPALLAFLRYFAA